MKRSGKTPMLRAKKLEKYLDIGEIYIKLEGSNPGGHKHDRIAEVLIRDAVNSGRRELLVHGSESYIRSMRYYADLNNLSVRVPLFKKEQWKRSRLEGEILIDLREEKMENVTIYLRELAEKKGMYLISESDSNTIISKIALEEVAKECLERLSYDVDTVFIQLGYGYTLSGIYGTLLRSWVEEKMEGIPKLYCGTIQKGNSILDHYEKSMKINEGGIDAFKQETSSLYMARNNPEAIGMIMKAVIETEGEIVGIRKEELQQAVTLMRKLENIKLSKNEAYSIAAFIKRAKEGKLQEGRHLIVLNDGYSVVNIVEIAKEDAISNEDLVRFTREVLHPYSDSIEETSDAIRRAREGGHILVSSRNGEYEGICVVVDLGFDDFIPTYHLAYIGVKPETKGRGVASELIQRAVELTEGNISLHVDLDNDRAKKLYKKLGFKHKYNRMIYQREE